MVRLRVIWILFCAYGLCACTSTSSEDVYADYGRRLANTVGKTVAFEPYQNQLMAFPDRKQLRIHEEPLDMGFLDFLKLNECGLQQLIAHRNSSLGKVMPDSQRLIYEQQLGRTLIQCLERDDIPLKAREWMQWLLEQKQNRRELMFWNTVMASPEMGQFFSMSGMRFNMNEIESGRREWSGALAFLMSWQTSLVSERDISGRDVENAYASLQAGQYGGQLLYSMEESIYWLDQVSRKILTKEAGLALCPQGVPTPKANVLQNIFNKYYVGKIQPYLSSVSREANELAGLFNRLMDKNHEALPSVFVAYYDKNLSEQPEALIPRFKQAVLNHAKSWQAVLHACGMMPGQGGNHVGT